MGKQRISRAGACAIVAFVLVLTQSMTAWAAVVANYPNFSSIDGLNLNGSAGQNGTELRLTDGFTEAGSVFTDRRVVDPTGAIHTSFQFHFPTGVNNDYPADGFAFVMQRSTDGAEALGSIGGALGYAGASAITPSVAVEFNLDFTNQHPYAAIVQNGNQGSPLLAQDINAATGINLCDCSGAPSTTYNGGSRYAWIDYSPSTHILKVFLATSSTKPSTPLMKRKVNIGRILGGRGRAGFTGGTGNAWIETDIQSWKLKVS